ncbi:MAG: ribosomal-protein-alanine N-acetyltransferase RimI, partial [Mycobacterium sp.]|nr:ribosomal-protein-alanine N-acetyltransferase RimI [Mycobacterium sp.]
MSTPATVVYDRLSPRDAGRCAELEQTLFARDDPWPAPAIVRELAARHNRYVAARV